MVFKIFFRNEQSEFASDFGGIERPLLPLDEV